MLQLPASFVTELTEFLALPNEQFARSNTIKCEYIELYARSSHRYVNDRQVESIEIARISIEPTYQGQGLYRQILDLFETCANGRCIYVENVHDEAQHFIYLSRGFTLVDSIPISFYKLGGV